MYTNETTAVINVVNVRSHELLHNGMHLQPYVLRVPNEKLGDTPVVDYLLNECGMREKLLDMLCNSLTHYFFGEIEVYVIQEDVTHEVKITEVFPEVPQSVKKIVCSNILGALEACMDKFNLGDTLSKLYEAYDSETEYPKIFSECIKELSYKGMTQYTVTLFVQNHLLEIYSSKEEKEYVASLLRENNE